MDVTAGIAPHMESTPLSYDDTVAYEEQLPTEEERAAAAARTMSLANRIGTSRVYLLSDSTASTTRNTKKKHESGEESAQEMEDNDDADTTYRNNAILFNGEPISHLPTARLFVYATHFDAHPMGLEWVDDQTCVLVFSTRKDAREAFIKLTKPAATNINPVAESGLDDVAPMTVDDPTDPDYTSARPFPVALWPPEERINQSLGQGQKLKGPIRMRWAKVDDVKKKGAKNSSQFYKRHGSKAGKELFNGRELPPSQPSKRKRQDMVDDEMRRKVLDKELDDFLAEDDTTLDAGDRNSRRRKRSRYRSSSCSPSRTPSSSGPPPSPPSKMRSDYISNDGRTLLERTSLLRYHPVGSDPLADVPDGARLILPLPRRQRGGRGRRGGEMVNDADSLLLEDRIHSTGEGRHDWGKRDGSNDRTKRGPRRERRQDGRNRPAKTQQELDDELDAFLNGKD